jgi:hypothetical protein
MLRASATSGTDNATFSTLPAGPSWPEGRGALWVGRCKDALTG